ncbi:RICIN domain-containing protein [Streptomyces sp. NPDC093225]|uniref:RICIN domain-containing protein n=1 Tax=Streptomyces sp. NPDC093225 TaxID=3366034 RepID=UPI00380C8513
MKRIARALATAGAAAALVVGLTTSAHADGWVTWKHEFSGKCLGFDSLIPLHPNDVRFYDGCDSYGAQWYEVYNSNDGTYSLKTKENTDACLTAYWDHDVYVERCNGNDYQRWYEVRTSEGWKLKHKATSPSNGPAQYLDGDGRSIYTHDENNSRYQLWH